MAEGSLIEKYNDYTGKRVVITRNLAEPDAEGHTTVELEATIETVSDTGLLIKPKSKSSLDILMPDEIENIVLAPTKEPTIKAKTLKLVGLGTARNHLLERHGYTLTQVNSLTEDAAFTLHQGIDHVAADLGHVHGEKAASETEADSTTPDTESSDTEVAQAAEPVSV